MANRRKTGKKTFSVDSMMLNVASALVRDFRDHNPNLGFCSDLLGRIAKRDVAEIRAGFSAAEDGGDVAEFKARHQLSSLFKRYRFKNDLYSDQELADMAIAKFRDTQERLAHVDLDRLDAFTNHVLDLAAGYVAEVLGPYSEEEHRSLCRFGRKASVGIPARMACEAARWELPISGSSQQIAWFDSEMSQVPAIVDYWAEQTDRDPEKRSIYQVTSCLALTLVPKTFKSLRSIMPNTTIGSYMSYGLGEMIRKRLLGVGYDIKTLQMKHRDLARFASRTGKYVTADLSSASDSITDALLARLFPSDWLDILRQSRIEHVRLPDGTVVQSLTFCTMGIGYTFPLQTLVFLALLKGVEMAFFNCHDRLRISVYGDDMIYDRRLHTRVCATFENVGLVINHDKTFVDGGFRESCGGDYYHGVDVRPFQPRSDQADVGCRAYEAILYKYINGLLMRWTEYEIEGTLDYLTSELLSIVHGCKIVPGDYPDESGIKCPTLGCWDFLQRTKHLKPKALGHGVYRFTYLRFKPEMRKETRHEPYLWATLQPFHHYIDYSSGWSNRVGSSRSSVVRCIEDSTGLVDSHEPLLRTEKLVPIQTFRSKLTGCRLRRTATFVTVSHTGSYTRQCGTSCFEDRR